MNSRIQRSQNNIIQFFKWFARNRRVQVIFLILVLSVPVFLVIYGIVIPVRNYKPTITATSAEQKNIDTADHGKVSLDKAQLVEVKEIISKENERAFAQSRLGLADKDSIYMVLDIPDSLLILEIKGVTVKKAKLQGVRISNRFSLISHENLLPWISRPFNLKSEESTIPKAPIVVKQAPKDTIEAAQQSSLPAPPDSTNVYFTLYFDRNFVLEVEQADPRPEGNTDKVRAYRSIKRKESNRSVMQTLQDPRDQHQPMLVSVEINGIDARAIYRAIAVNTKLILRL